MTTRLDKVLKRQVTVDGADYTIAIDPSGMRVTGEGRRKPEVELRWRDLLNGEAAMAPASNASLLMNGPVASKKTTRPHTAPAPARTQPPEKRPR